MVGLSDIPCLGKAVDRVSDATVEAVVRGLRYLLCYNSIVNNLNSEIEKVKVQEDRVSRKADAESANGKTIQDHVTKWQKEVQEIKSRADQLSKQRPSWNPLTRFRLGRKAAHEAKNLADLTFSGVELLGNEIAYLSIDANIPITDTAYQMFDSREEAYGKLWEALVKEDGLPILGIYGMPGVGKTRMMEQIWEEAINKKVFNKVTRANVGGEKIDVINLQNQLAGFLGCHLESNDNEVLRAKQLKNSLINGGKTLVILDDLWDPIPLQNLGIPVGDNISYKGCKILLTSRRRDVCLLSGCKDPVMIYPLTSGEAWDMFQKTVDTSKIDSLHDTSLAKKVCKECAGLPLLIQALGNALKYATVDSWKDAHSQLENCNLEEIDRIEPRVYTGIKLSFDRLKKAEKTCLLLCSLFAEDADIEIKMLEDFARGSQLLNHARNIKGVVDKLKSSSLLIQGKTPITVKMHDIIRDVARSIAAMDQQYAFLFIRGDWYLPDIDDYTTRKVLQFVESNHFGFPTGLVCQDLHTLWLECNNQPPQFSNSFLEGIENLKMLVLKGALAFSEQISAQSFDKLTCLILDHCGLNKTCLSIVPKNLETLRILNCHLPNPLDLSKLRSLRKLEVVCDKEIAMVDDAVSTLPPTLVELHIPGGFRICDAEGEIFMPISLELNKLTQLTSLNILLKDTESCPAENIADNLLDFNIGVGTKYVESGGLYLKSVYFGYTCIEGGGEFLVARAEEVFLNKVNGSVNGFSNSRRQAFSTLKRLYIFNCEDMEHVVEWKAQNEIQQTQPLTSFSNLTLLIIYQCRGLKYLFSTSVVKCLVQLESLSIDSCSRLEEVVISNESVINDDGVIINFPKLKELKLMKLQSLRRFYGGKRSSTTLMEYAAPINRDRSDCLFDGMAVFPSIEILDIGQVNISEIWEKDYCNNNSSGELTSTLQNLQTLHIWYCNSLRNVFLPSVAKHLLRLKELDVLDCEMISEIIGEEKEGDTINEFVFPQLTKLKLYKLPNFNRFCFSELVEAPTSTHLHGSFPTPKVLFPKLVELVFIDVKTIIWEEMELSKNDSSSEIKRLKVWYDYEQQLPPRWELQLPNLEELMLKNCLWHGICGEDSVGQFLINSYPSLSFQRLKVVEVNSCGVSALFSCSVFKNLHQLETLQVEDCPLLEEVVREENNIVATSGNTISLFQLRSIKLYNLPKIKSFSGSTSYTFNMPAFGSISVRDCPQMENFTCLEISTPLMPDFNTQIQTYLSEKYSYGFVQTSLWYYEVEGSDN